MPMLTNNIVYGNRPITTGKVVPSLQNGSRRSESLILKENAKSFSEIMSEETYKSQEIIISKHAQQRLDERGIKLDIDAIEQINDAFNRAKEKGIKDSLMVTKQAMLIVNVPNKTVVTAVDSKSIKENVFTNIDGAVFV